MHLPSLFFSQKRLDRGRGWAEDPSRASPSSDLPARAVVAAVQGEIFVADQSGECHTCGSCQQESDLGRPRSSVDEVAVEEVTMRVRWVAVQSENLQEVEELAVSVSAYGELVAALDVGFHHCRLVVDQLLHGQYYLEDILLVQLLALLEPDDHVVYELLRHLILQVHTIVRILDHHRVQLLTRIVLRLRNLVRWVLSYYHLPVDNRIMVLEDCRVCYRSSVVGLGEGGVDIDGMRRIRYRITICFQLDIRLRAVGIERRLLIVQLDRFGVVLYRRGPVILGILGRKYADALPPLPKEIQRKVTEVAICDA
ncbi:hypothetical protein KC367_g270 [Hortaea werneckii]|nr:hypothetical protein KC367_g270 [Hortaea werneckii]